MKRSPGLARVIGIVLVLGLVLLIIKWALITAAILAVPFGAWWLYDRTATQKRQRAEQQRASAAARRRAEVESLASVDAAGGCGWCGSRLAHIGQDGRLVLPLDWHRAEIEQVLQSENEAGSTVRQG
ncbi:hypothetical protein [Pseudonocardia xinjiangensis]|uniref:Uncharacterized protein n=1 Tax=Pseudonocardia xinjiangensis TaxID=75289 RepID=A0ABX1R9M3_9PSEU|nr:hypothetical protein [Pseudonocardia xinjiangensis]NMH75923.1 hypothetical protein [Pseudonocardia xinjiangensis]